MTFSLTSRRHKSPKVVFLVGEKKFIQVMHARVMLTGVRGNMFVGQLHVRGYTPREVLISKY